MEKKSIPIKSGSKAKKSKDFTTKQQTPFISAVGRRKESVARVRLFTAGKGVITVNNKPSSEYFPGSANEALLNTPFIITNTSDKFDVTIKVLGGGSSGQLGAVLHGISRALQTHDKEKYRSLLKKEGLMTRDPRTKQRHKAGYAQKSRAKKQSPKR